VSEAGPGCHIARDATTPWILGCDSFDPDEYDDVEDLPEICLDPDAQTLSVLNAHADGETRVCYITLYSTKASGKNGVELTQGTTTDVHGTSKTCITFIVCCATMTIMHLCHLHVPEGESILDVSLDSDVQPWNRHDNADDEHAMPVGFPLLCHNNNVDQNDHNCMDETEGQATEDQYLCTQGEGGELTHFFSGNLHAIDFRCSIGTPLLAVADGIVCDVRDENNLTGVGVSNLFQWNSILLELDVDDESRYTGEVVDANNNGGGKKQNYVQGGPLFVEYVHMAKDSALVKEGDRVKRGQMIGKSGSVGFSPEPHLHFAAYRSRDPTASTVRVRFHEGTNTPFLPTAGNYYNSSGIAKQDGLSTGR
jgi:hypothetical protein